VGVNQTERFFRRLDTAAIVPNKFQRSDSAPRVVENGVVVKCRDGVIDSADSQLARLYFNQVNPLTPPCGPTAPVASTASFEVTGSQTEAAQANKTAAHIASVLAVESTTADIGGTVNVNVRVTPQGNETQYGFVLNFDPSALSFTGTNGAGTTGETSASCNLTAMPGEIFCAVTGFKDNLSGTSDMFGEIGSGEQILISPQFVLTAESAAGMVTTLSITEASASNGEKIRAVIINEYGDENIVISTDVERPISEGEKRLFFTKTRITKN
jgi:hypothetical protein